MRHSQLDVGDLTVALIPAFLETMPRLVTLVLSRSQSGASTERESQPSRKGRCPHTLRTYPSSQSRAF